MVPTLRHVDALYRANQHVFTLPPIRHLFDRCLIRIRPLLFRGWFLGQFAIVLLSARILSNKPNHYIHKQNKLKKTKFSLIFIFHVFINVCFHFRFLCCFFCSFFALPSSLSDARHPIAPSTPRTWPPYGTTFRAMRPSLLRLRLPLSVTVMVTTTVTLLLLRLGHLRPRLPMQPRLFAATLWTQRRVRPDLRGVSRWSLLPELWILLWILNVTFFSRLFRKWSCFFFS